MSSPDNGRYMVRGDGPYGNYELHTDSWKAAQEAFDKIQDHYSTVSMTDLVSMRVLGQKGTFAWASRGVGQS